jgi:hypothetical protein
MPAANPLFGADLAERKCAAEIISNIAGSPQVRPTGCLQLNLAAYDEKEADIQVQEIYNNQVLYLIAISLILG